MDDKEREKEKGEAYQMLGVSPDLMFWKIIHDLVIQYGKYYISLSTLNERRTLNHERSHTIDNTLPCSIFY